MDKVVEFIKKNKVKVAGAFIMIAAFVILLIINLHVDYTSDDFRYRFIYDTPGNPLPTTKKISSLWDVIISMINHWKLCNGRVVAHGLLQMVMPFGKLFFRIFNSLVYVSLGFLIYKHSVYGKKSNLSLLVLVYIGMWFFLPQFGLSVMWASGAANYLWCAAIMLSFMLPYRMYAANGADSVKDSWKNAVLMGLFGIFAGCTNENTGGGVVLICTLFILFYKIKGFKIPKWSWIGVITAVCGVVLLLAAPGNYRIDSKASFAEILIRFKDVIVKTETLAFWLFVIIAVVLILALLDKSRHTKLGINWLVPLIYFVGSAAMISVLAFAAMRPERTWFTAIVLLIVIAGWLYSEIKFSDVKPYIITASKWGLTAVFTIVFLISFNKEFSAVKSTYDQIKPGLEAIEQAVEKGENEVEIPLVTPSDSKYDPYNGALYAGDSPTLLVNAWMEKYYGIEKITGVK